MLIERPEPNHTMTLVVSPSDTPFTPMWDHADIVVRLEPVIFELERVQEDMLVISHASVIRCLVSLSSASLGVQQLTPLSWRIWLVYLPTRFRLWRLPEEI